MDQNAEKSTENDCELILSTAWYMLNSKFPVEIYREWIGHFLGNVKNAKLVIYTDRESEWVLEPHIKDPKNTTIKKIIKPMKQFYGYKYRKEWKENHAQNYLLNEKTEWKLNMLWNEKVHFVYETYEKKYHVEEEANRPTKKRRIYGWCDIGYFRCRPECRDIGEEEIQKWPSMEKLKELNPKKIYYARVNNDSEYIKDLFLRANIKSEAGIPLFEIPPTQNSIAGGFFLLSPEKITWWRNTYDTTLRRYFYFKLLVKDDQIILVDAIFSNMPKFYLIQTTDPSHDKWFQFQRYLLHS